MVRLFLWIIYKKFYQMDLYTLLTCTSIMDFTFGFIKRLKCYEINVTTSDGLKSKEGYLDLLEKDLPYAKVENHFCYIQTLPIRLPDENVEMSQNRSCYPTLQKLA